MSADDQRQEASERRTRSLAEITVLLLTLAVVLFMIGYSIYHALTAAGTPPFITATPHFDRIIRRDGVYLLPVTVRNQTRPTVENATVTVTSRRPDGRVDERQLQFDFLVEEDALTGYVVFPYRPQPEQVQVEVSSFRMP